MSKSQKSWLRRLFSRRAPVNRHTRYVRLSLEALENRAVPAAVTSIMDTGINVVGELRTAIINAAPNAIVDFGLPQGSKITLNPNLGQIMINKNLTIDGGNLNLNLSIDGGGVTNLFSVTNNATVTIKNLALNNGFVPQASGGD